jgi:hypothetical protein
MAFVPLAVITLMLPACIARPAEPLYARTYCRARLSPARGGGIRLDGPGSGGAHLFDSLVVVVNGTERWRGYRDGCENGYDVDFGGLIAPSDSVVGLELQHGERVRSKYHVSGEQPVAMVIETRRTHD